MLLKHFKKLKDPGQHLALSRMSCPICLNSYTAKNRKEVKCQYCPVSACLTCLQQYILSSVEDCHCHSCKNRWTTEFMNNNFTLAFRGTTLRKHRRKVLVSREKSLLPSMQVYVEAKIKYNNALKLKKELVTNMQGIDIEYKALEERLTVAQKAFLASTIHRDSADLKQKARVQYTTLFTKYMKFKKEVYRPAYKLLAKTKRDVTRLNNMYLRGDDSASVTTRREFLMRCPAEECRGFISSAYVCGICSKKTCSDCLEVIQTDHVCKQESIESAKAIKKETRACPKCAARIFKIDGCDQMWCTVDGCNTAFSWNSGQIVSGRVHNPHYYEWLRTQSAAPPREIGDIPCGGLPNLGQFIYRVISIDALTPKEKTLLIEITRNLTEFEDMLRNFPSTMGALGNKDINVRYLMKEIDDDQWQRELEFNENRFIRKREIGQILQTLVTVCAEIMRNVYDHLDEEYGYLWVRDSAFNNLNMVRIYANNAFLSIGNTMKFAVPTIGDNWRWNTPRIHYRTKAGPKV